MKKQYLTIIMIMGFTCNLFAGDFENHVITTYHTLQQGVNTWNETKMQESLAHFQRLLNLQEKEWLVRFYIAFAEYRMSIFYMEKDKKKAGQFLNDAIDELKKSQAVNDTFPESYALLASCYGNKIGLAPLKGMFLGPRSGAAIEKAVLLGPENPRVWLHKGIGSYHTPKAFGGGKEKALEELKKAVVLYEKEKVLNPVYPQWGHDEAYVWIGIIYKEMEQLEDAEQAWKKGLEINPQNGWIRHDLQPDLNKQKEE
jgi:tetratricopeptide (TPR) repeat protein